jgi:hypothetical protein
MIRTVSMKLAKLLSVVVFFLVVMMPTAQATVCASNPCSNGGTCGRNAGTFNCSCAFGWFGSYCTNPFCSLYNSAGECVVDSDGNHRFANSLPPPVIFPAPVPNPVPSPTLVPTPPTIAVSVIALIGLIGLRWSRRKR